MGQFPELRLQALILTFHEGCVIDLSDLEGQKIDLFEPFLLIQRRILQPLCYFRPSAVRLGAFLLRPLQFIFRITVHQGEMILRVQKTLVLMLTMYVDQQCCELAHSCDGDHFPVDPADTASLPVAAGYHNFPVQIRKIQFLEPVPHPLRLCFKRQLNHRTLRVFSGKVLEGSGPQGGTDRADHDRLAGTCLTGQYVQSAIQRDLFLFNQSHVPDMYTSEHMVSPV